MQESSLEVLSMEKRVHNHLAAALVLGAVLTSTAIAQEAAGATSRTPFGKLPVETLNAWVKLQVLEQRVLVLETLKAFSENWAFARHQVVGLWSQKETLDYLRGRLKDGKSVPIRLHIFFLPELKDAAEELRQKICTLAREAKVDAETEVRMEQSVWVGSGESPFYLRAGQIRTYYPGSMPRPDGGRRWLTNGLVDPNDLEQHILWRLTMPKNVPLTFRIEYDEASYLSAKQVAETARAVAKRVGLTELVGVTGALVEAVPESAFLGKWQALGDGVIQSVDIQPAGVCQVLVGEGSSVLQAGTSVKGTWSWTVKEILLDIKDPVMGRKGYPPYIYRASVNSEGNLVIQKGEVWPQGSFMHTQPPQTIYKKVPSPSEPAGTELGSKPATERATYGGTIIDEQGKPIEGVAVVIWWDDAAGRLMRGRCTTDAQGHWQVALSSEVRNVDIQLAHRDYIGDESYRQDKPPLSRLRDGTSVMVMKRGLKLSGKVQNEEGKPIGNALILPHDRYATAVGGAALEDATTARTGADGRFVLTGLPVGPRELTVTAPGYGPEGVPVEVTPEMGAIRVTMRPGGVFQGQVLDEDDKPVEDAGVTCCRWQTEQGHIISLTGRTDAQGHFTIADVPLKGTMEFYVNKREFLSHHHSIVLPAESYHATLYHPPTLSGTVVDDRTGAPVADFELAQGILWPGARAAFWREPQAVHSESGAFTVTIDRFVVRTVPPSCVVRILAGGYVPEASSPVLVGEKPTPLVVRLHRGQPWSGFVRDPADRPAANASVAWIGPDHIAFIRDGKLQPQFTASPEWVVRTDSQGHFELPPAKTEGIILALHDTGYGWWRSADFTRDSAVHLTAWSRIAGTVRRADSDDHTMQLKAQLADPAAETNNLPIRWFFDTTSHVGGQFAFEFVPSLRLAVGHIADKKFFLADYVTPQPGQTCNLTIQAEPPGSAALRSLVGQVLPALKDIGLESAAARLQNQRVLLCFFDLGQRPSRRCMDLLVQQAEALREKGITVAAIQAAATDEGAWKTWVKERSGALRFGQIKKDTEKVKSAWGVQSLPWLILTDKEHVVRAEGFGPDELESKIRAAEKE
jgi:hypothetical protein